MKSIVTQNDRETERAGARLAPLLTPGTVVAFYGDLGAGKTTFIRGLAGALGITQAVTSPTYTIVNEYEGNLPLFHFDMYRLQSADELFDIGWEDYLERGGILAVEWSENVEEAFPADTVRVRIEKEGEETRRITLENLPDEGRDGTWSF